MLGKRKRTASDIRSFCNDAGFANKFQDWEDDELIEIDFNQLLAVGFTSDQASRVTCKIRALKKSEDRVRPLNQQLQNYARTGFRRVQGLFFSHKESLVDEIDRLLREGAEVNAVDELGETALHGACRGGHRDIVARLLQAGADINVVNIHGKKPNVEPHLPLLAVAEHGPMDVVRALMEGGSNLNQQDEMGHTPLHQAAKVGNLEVVELLVAKGCDIDRHDKRGRTALHVAAAEGHVKCTNYLLEHGANVNARTDAGTTALHWVAVLGCQRTAKALLEHGAEVNSRNNEGFTPLDRATDEEMKKLLKERGGRESLGWWSFRS